MVASLPESATIQPADGPETGDRDAFLGELTRFADSGRATAHFTDAGIPYFVNQFWTSAQRAGHAIHEVSYRGCFKPQLPRFFIERLSAPGELVYDPFSGRGTTPIEAALRGRAVAGNDVNPLAALLTRPRLNTPTIAAIAARLADIPWDTGRIERADLETFFHPDTLRHICALRSWLLHRALAGTLDGVDAWIRMVALNRLTGHSSGFLSVRTLPPNQAVSLVAQRRLNAKHQLVPPLRDVPALLLRKSRALLRDGAVQAVGTPCLLTGPAWASPALADASVALVVTSPPFLDTLQYAQDNWLRGWFAGLDMASVPLTQLRCPVAWQAMVRRCLSELARVVRPGGWVAFEVGEVRHGQLLLERLVWQAAEELAFDRIAVMVNDGAFSKTSQCWGIANNHGGTNTNRIVLLRRQ